MWIDVVFLGLGAFVFSMSVVSAFEGDKESIVFALFGAVVSGFSLGIITSPL